MVCEHRIDLSQKIRSISRLLRLCEVGIRDYVFWGAARNSMFGKVSVGDHTVIAPGCFLRTTITGSLGTRVSMSSRQFRVQC